MYITNIILVNQEIPDDREIKIFNPNKDNTLSLGNCATVSNGDDDYCSCNTCSENQGGCFSDDQCQAGLICDTANDCSSNFGHNFLVYCCQIGQIGTYAFGIMYKYSLDILSSSDLQNFLNRNIQIV